LQYLTTIHSTETPQTGKQFGHTSRAQQILKVHSVVASTLMLTFNVLL